MNVAMNAFRRRTPAFVSLIAALALFGLASSAASISVNAAGTAQVTVTLVSSTNPACPNQVVTFTVTVQQVTGITTPTGTVTLIDNGTPVGTQTLDSFGQATFNESFTAAGTHAMLASYSGSSTFASGVSNPVSEAISPTCPGGPPACQEADGNGDFQGNNGNGNFQMDDDNCEENHQGGNGHEGDNVRSSNRGDGKDFQSTRIQSTKFDGAAHTLTITGIGLSAGNPVAFTLVALASGNGVPGWVSMAFTDGYTNAGSLTSGIIVLH